VHPSIVAWTDKNIRPLMEAYITDNIFKVRRTYLCRSTGGFDFFSKPVIHIVTVTPFVKTCKLNMRHTNSALNLFSI
jgi:hypothetical protein